MGRIQPTWENRHVASVLTPPTEQRFVLNDIDWSTYRRFGDLLGDRHIRITYDRGVMELMTLSPERERSKKLLARLIEALAEEMEIDMAGFGSMTCQRDDLERGLEPDECYWIEHEPQVSGRDEIDLAVDPPPDLVLEVEISRSALNRLALYARLGVPEVWRWDGQTLSVCHLTENSKYSEATSSRAFPFLPITELTRFLTMRSEMSDTKLLRAFRAWVREQITLGWPQPSTTDSKDQATNGSKS
jgi:Uma2 family endonuclease